MATNPPGIGTKTFSINLPKHLVEALSKLSKASGKSRNKLIAEALQSALDNGTIAALLENQSIQIARAVEDSKAPKQSTARQRVKGKLLEGTNSEPESAKGA